MARKRHRGQGETGRDPSREEDGTPSKETGAAASGERSEDRSEARSAEAPTPERAASGKEGDRADGEPMAAAGETPHSAGGPARSEPAPAGSTMSVPPAEARRGARARLGGLIGGLVGGAAVALVWMLATRDQAPDPRLVARLDGLDGKLAAVEGRLAATEGLTARVEELQQRIDSATGATTELRQSLDALGERMAKVEKEVEPLLALARTVEEMGGGVAQLRSRLSELADRLAGFAETVGRLPTLEQGASLDEAVQQLRDQLGTLGERAAGLERQVAERIRDLQAGLGALSRELAARTEELAGRLQQQFAALDERAKALERLPEQIGQLRSALETSLGELRSQIDALRRAQSTLAARVERVEATEPQLREALGALRDGLAALDGRAGEISAQLAALGRQVSELREVRARDLGVLLASTEIAAAANDGRPYAEALELLRRVAGDAPELAEVIGPLERFADDGIPTLVELSARFEELAPAMRGEPETGDEDLLGQTRRNLGSLLTVRRRDEPPRQADAAIAAAREHLARGDVAAAAGALAPLAEAGNGAAHDWLALVEARGQALDALDRLASFARQRLADATGN